MSSFRKATGQTARPAAVGVPAPAPRSEGGAPGQSPSAPAAVAHAVTAGAAAPSPAPGSAPTGTLPCGTRRWVDGRLLASCGIPSLDAFLGGGLPLGGLVLLEEDFEAAQASAMSALFLAEGIACGQSVLLCGSDSTPALARQLSRLPMNASRDSRDLAAAAAAGAGGAANHGGEGNSSSAFEYEDGSGSTKGGGWDTSGAGLKIAWQYRKYLTQSSDSSAGEGAAAASSTASSSSRRPLGAPSTPITKYGHTFDLSRRIHPAVLAEHAPRTALLSLLELFEGLDGRGEVGSSPTSQLPSVPASVAGAVQAAATAACLPSSSPVIRVVLQGFGGCWGTLPGVGDCALGGPGVDALPPSSASSSFSLTPRTLLQTLARLRAWVHASAAPVYKDGKLVAPAVLLLATMPTHALAPTLAGQARGYFDAVLKVRAFTDPAGGAETVGTTGAGEGAAGPVFTCPTLGQALPRSATASLLASALRSGGATSGSPPPEFADYTGLLALRRLPRLGPGLTPQFQPDTATLLFKRDRKKLVVEKPSLPPGGDEGGPAPAPAPSAASRQTPSAPEGGGDGLTFGVNADTDEVEAHVPAGPLAGDGSGALLAAGGGGSSCSAGGGGGARRGLMDKLPSSSPFDF